MNGNGTRDARDGASAATPENDLSGRLERLGAELDRRQPASDRARASASPASDPTALGRALRASTEFVAGIIAGTAVGWAIDKGLGTSPWGLIVFLLLGFAAGVLNVLRTAGLPTGRPGGAPNRSGETDGTPPRP